MERYEPYKLLNNLTALNYVTRKWIKLIYLPSGQYYVNILCFKARSLVVSDLRWETKGSRFESGC